MFTNALIKATTLAVSLACLGLGSTAVLAGTGDGHDYDRDEEVPVDINGDMTRRAPDSTSGSGHTVEVHCPADPSGNAWQGATATLKIEQHGISSKVRVKVKGAVPNTLFTVWLRMAGIGPGGNAIGPNPVNGGGATPLLPSAALDGALRNSPPFPGTPTPTNGFITDRRGNATFTIDLDFPIFGGVYPFQRASAAAVQELIDAGSSWPLMRIPSPVVNPAEPGISAPFRLRVISHCTDGLGHGLSPATREAWFDYP